MQGSTAKDENPIKHGIFSSKKDNYFPDPEEDYEAYDWSDEPDWNDDEDDDEDDDDWLAWDEDIGPLPKKEPRYEICKDCPYGKGKPCVGTCMRKLLGQIKEDPDVI